MDLKRNLFNLFASWSGPSAKPLGVICHGNTGTSSGGSNSNANANTNTGGTGNATVSGSSANVGNVCAEEEKLQLAALQVSDDLCLFHFFLCTHRFIKIIYS